MYNQNMNKVLNHIKTNKWFYLVLLISLFTLIIYCINKNTYHVDESLSYALSNFDMGWLDYPSNGILTRYQMNGYRATNNLFNYEMVWHWQALDEHPPLYYALLHTICSITPGLLSKWSGLIINIVCFGLTMMTMYRTMNELSTNKTMNTLVCLMYGLNPIILENTTVIRMYVMLTFTFVWFVYGCVRFVKTKRNLYLLIIYFSTVIGGLTNYFYYVFLVTVCILMLVLWLVLKLDRKLLVFAILTIVAAGLTNLFIFPYVLDLFFQDKNSALTAFENVEHALINLHRVKEYLKISPFGFYGSIMVIISSLFILIWSTIKSHIDITNGLTIVCLLTYIIYFALISTMAFDIAYRFISPATPLLYITIAFVATTVIHWLDHYWRYCGIGIGMTMIIANVVLVGLPQYTIEPYAPLTYAKAHEGDNLIIATPINTAHFAIDRIFLERDHYGYVYNTDLSEAAYHISDDLYWLDEATVYLHQDFDVSALQAWLNEKTNLTTIEDTGITSYEYKLYQVY